MRKTCLKKARRYHTFDPEKMHFRSTFEVTVPTHSSFMYCHNIQGLLEELGIPIYNSIECWLFIDSSKRSLKCVLLHSGNLYGAVSIGHTGCLHEEHGNITTVIELLQYHKHNWIICVDFKMVAFLLGQQHGYTKYLCFLCMWDSKAWKKNWVEMNWPLWR